MLPHLQGNIEIGRHKDRNAEVGNTKQLGTGTSKIGRTKNKMYKKKHSYKEPHMKEGNLKDRKHQI